MTEDVGYLGVPIAEAEKKYAHGTRARYVLAKCRCFPCKVANSDYVHEMTASKRNVWRLHYIQAAGHYVVRNSETKEIRLRTKIKATAVRVKDALNKRIPSECDGEWVDVKRAKAHIIRMQAAGVGYKTIAARAGLSNSTVFEILKGRVTRSKRSTIEAILGVAGGPIGSVNIDAGPTWALIRALVAAGYRKGWIAMQIGSKKPALQIRRDKVMARTAERVKALFEQLFASDEKLRRIVDPEGERRRDLQRARELERPQAVPLSKRDPAIRKRWDTVFADLGASI